MSWDRDAIERAGDWDAMYAVMAKARAAIGDQASGEATVVHEGKTYFVRWSPRVCPTIH